MLHDFQNEKKYCPHCADYVCFLQSLNDSYCVECGSKVQLFSSDDKKAFLRAVRRDRDLSNKRTGIDRRNVS
jgi:hypothetical protein